MTEDAAVRIVEDAVAKVMSTHDLTNMTERIISEILAEIKDEEVEMHYEFARSTIQALDRKGFFELRGAVEKAAKALGISRVTLYNYMNFKYSYNHPKYVDKHNKAHKEKN